MDNVIRNYFTGRLSCPSPEYDQVVYKYHAKEHNLEFLWVVPSKDTCQFLVENALVIERDQKDLLKFVLEFNDGTLLRKAKEFNGENIS